jgi:hypothetical protein
MRNIATRMNAGTDYQVHCCQNAIDLLATGLWNFKGLSRNICNMEEFDQANSCM